MDTTKKWRSILVLDQDLQNLNIASLVLVSLGNLQVQACNSVLEAADAGKVHVPDVMLLELKADYSGLQDAAYLHQQVYGKETPVIFFVEESHKQQFSELTQPWVIAYIWKPYDPLLLAEQVLDILDLSKI